MAKRRIPKDETSDERYVREHKERISNLAERTEKNGWNRRKKQLAIDIKAYDLAQKEMLKLKKKHKKLEQKVKDDGFDLRASCVHPYDEIIHEGDNVFICKFCETRIRFNE